MVIAGTFLRQARLDERLARGILPAARGQHLSQDDFGDLIGLDAGLGEQRTDDSGAELGRGHLRKRAAELAYGRARCAGDDDIGHGMDSSLCTWKPASSARVVRNMVTQPEGRATMSKKSYAGCGAGRRIARSSIGRLRRPATMPSAMARYQTTS
jgi:hypothetical protein